MVTTRSTESLIALASFGLPLAAEALGWFADAASGFLKRYRSLLNHIASETHDSQRVAVCTIYEGNLGSASQRAATAGIAIFNDAIVRAVRPHGWPIIELRDFFTDPADYANPIEPSAVAERSSRAPSPRTSLGDRDGTGGRTEQGLCGRG